MSLNPAPAVALVAVAAWVVLVAGTFGGAAFFGHDRLCGVSPGSLTAAGAFLASWSVMVAAMMLPDLAAEMRERRSAFGAAELARFLAGFFAVWEIFGCVLLAAGGFIGRAFDAAGLLPINGDTLGAALLGLVAVAQFMSARFVSRLRAATRSHPPWRGTNGWRAGLAAGEESFHCCWGIMTLMLAAKLHDPLSVAAFAVFIAYVRRGRFGIRAARLLGVAALADAVFALTLRTSPL